MCGYGAKFTHPLLKRHKCPLCQLAMRNPVQAMCGHLFCRDCLEPVFQKRHPICPLDNKKLTRVGMLPDHACRREILRLQVVCSFRNCPWMGILKKLEDHLATCEYRDEQCTQCGQYIQHLNMSVHQREQCPMRPTKYTCPHCSMDALQQPHQVHSAIVALSRNRPCFRHTSSNPHETALLCPQEETQEGYEDERTEIVF